jgi:hypothetical protein
MSCDPVFAEYIISAEEDQDAFDVPKVGMAVVISGFVPRNSRIVEAMRVMEQRDITGIKIPPVHIFRYQCNKSSFHADLQESDDLVCVVMTIKWYRRQPVWKCSTTLIRRGAFTHNLTCLLQI